MLSPGVFAAQNKYRLCAPSGSDEKTAARLPRRGGRRYASQYRLIYKIDRENVYVLVEQVTPHDYRGN